MTLNQTQSSPYSPPPAFTKGAPIKKPPIRRVHHREQGNSSKSLANPLSDVSLVYGVAAMIRRDREKNCKRNKTVFTLIDRILAATMKTMHLWKGTLSTKACEKIAERGLEFQRVHFVNDCPPYVYTSFCLEVLENRMNRKYPGKKGRYLHSTEQREALKKCIVVVNRLHRYFDRSLDKPIGWYAKADIAAEAWIKSEN